MKKIGIITFHCAHNYGAMLQAYALKKYLLQIGYEAHIVNYRCRTILDSYYQHFSVVQMVGRRGLLFPWRWGRTAKTLYWVHTHRQEHAERREKFVRFEKTYLLDPECAPVSPKEIGRLRLDAFIFGSDQIWNSDITGEEEAVYWGQFQIEGQQRIVYGASHSQRMLTPAEQKNIALCLSSFDGVSVRENFLAEQVKEITGQQVPVVVDPTLLLVGQDYEKLLPPNHVGEKPYVLLYMMHESEESKKAARRTGLPMKIIGCRNKELFCDIGPEKILDAGPIEFLDLLRHAACVITNSFHGTVFSILFQRPFCVISEEDPRIDNLLLAAGLENARILDASEFSPESFVQSTSETFQKLQSSIDFSKEYLSNVLGGS